MEDCLERLNWIHINDILKDTCTAIRFTFLVYKQNYEFIRRTNAVSRKRSFVSVVLLYLFQTVCNNKTHNSKNARH